MVLPVESDYWEGSVYLSVLILSVCLSVYLYVILLSPEFVEFHPDG